MRSVFADTNFLVASINTQDQWHQRAEQAWRGVGSARLVTSEWVLAEVLNYYAATRATFRRAAAELCREMCDDAGVELVPATHENYLAGLTLYQARLDKSYSLTDCISMNLMRERRITDILTHDRHFAQEGFTVLM